MELVKEFALSVDVIFVRSNQNKADMITGVLQRCLKMKNESNLKAIFLEMGTPEENLTDNGSAFNSRHFRTFAKDWGIRLQFQCA